MDPEGYKISFNDDINEELDIINGSQLKELTDEIEMEAKNVKKRRRRKLR